MIKNVFILMWEKIRKTYFFKGCEWIYGKIIHLLFVGKWMPTMMAYGGFHILILILLGCQAAYMWLELDKNNITSFNQIIYRFYGDTLHNYRLNYLDFEKDMRRRPDNIYNENDIQYKYGFIRNENQEGNPLIKTIKYKNFSEESDLVAKIRYVSCNNLPDTINNRRKHEFDVKNNRLYNSEYISNHERFYYDISLLEDTIHRFHRVSHAKDHLIEWENSKPCFSFWIGFIVDDYKDLKEESEIRIKFNDFEKDFTSNGYRKPLIFEKVIPQPTVNNLKEIVYRNQELYNVLKQGGIYISGVDPEKKEIVEKQNLRSTVLLGTIIAFMLDIIVRLIIKWRKLKEYKDQKSSNH